MKKNQQKKDLPRPPHPTLCTLLVKSLISPDDHQSKHTNSALTIRTVSRRGAMPPKRSSTPRQVKIIQLNFKPK